MEYVIIIVVSCIATFLSSVSGGGASMINIPAYLMLGIPFPLASVMQKASSTCWVLPASYNYLKKRKIDWSFIVYGSLIGLLGVWLGVKTILSVDQRILEIVIGILILLLVVYSFFKKEFGVVEKVTSKIQKTFSYPWMFLFGFYEALFGAGNGVFFSAVTVQTRGYDLARALGHYYAIVFPWVLFACILLMTKGYIDMYYIISAVAGSLVGGWYGSKLGSMKGSKFIRYIFIAMGFVLGLKLLIGI